MKTVLDQESNPVAHQAQFACLPVPYTDLELDYHSGAYLYHHYSTMF